VTITCKNGTPKTVLASVAAFPESAEGEHVVVLYDLTEHKRAQALQQENDRFQLDAIERFPGMVSYWGRDLRCRMGNAPYSQWFNRTVEQMRGVHQRELLGDDIFNLNKPHLEAVLNGENQQFERIVKKGDGTFANVLVHYVPHKSNGEIPGFFVYVTDVTPIRRDQEQLRTGDIALNSISQGVIIADKDQNITWTNQAFSSITGYALADVLGRNCRLLQGPLTDSRTVDAIRSALRAARDFAGEILNYRKDGTPFWNDLAISPVLDSEGRPSHFVGITRDITERKQALEHKARLEVELQQAQKLESVGRLAGGIAHDFNNLLTVILGHAEIATSRPDVAPPVREAIDEIHKAAMRSAELTRNLLAFARRQTIAPKVLDLNLSISGMRTLLQRLVGPEIDFVCRLNADPALVRLDPSQIDQIVINLCVNAKDAMPAGGRITIETANRTFEEDSASRPDNSLLGSYVSLAITDTGCGMDSQTQTHIFEPFFTTKEVGKGTGLGLATVYGAVTQNGGFIDLVSSPGRGTTFTLYLPLQID
jgi:PAS domain S-box-containing protein